MKTSTQKGFVPLIIIIIVAAIAIGGGTYYYSKNNSTKNKEVTGAATTTTSVAENTSTNTDNTSTSSINTNTNVSVETKTSATVNTPAVVSPKTLVLNRCKEIESATSLQGYWNIEIKYFGEPMRALMNLDLKNNGSLSLSDQKPILDAHRPFPCKTMKITEEKISGTHATVTASVDSTQTVGTETNGIKGTDVFEFEQVNGKWMMQSATPHFTYF